MDIFLDFFRGADGFTALSVYQGALRLSLPILALLIVIRSARSLLGFRREPEVWAWLRLATGELLPVTHWENLLGRKKSADIVLDFATVSKNHAVLTRQDDGGWTVTDIGARGRVEVNGTPVLSGQGGGQRHAGPLRPGGLRRHDQPWRPGNGAGAGF